uniref:Uncharacterized protein LOC114328484 isoform X1 n=1 Tax=Diabrotica virgifera virgifera TaxID=50390 RepID=A0A6P7FEA4_DIAVI
MTLNNSKFNTPFDIASAFAKYFASVYDTSDCTHCHSHSTEWGSFTFKHITELDVINSIKKLKPKKSTGPDEIPPYIYKGLAEPLAKPLAFLFNMSIEQEYFPDILKMATIPPIHKKDKKMTSKTIGLSAC